MRCKLWVGTVALAALAGTVFAADPPQPKPPTAAEQAEMEAMMKAATPGDAHKKLNAFVGTFSATVKMWQAPGAPPAESSGVSESSWVLGGRWVEEKFSSNFMGMPFSGVGYTGYDNIKKQYVGTWMDTMSTSVMISTGTGDGKSYSFTSSVDDPMTGKSTPMTMKVTVADDDHHSMEMWSPAPDGKMFKMMEITYVRKK